MSKFLVTGGAGFIGSNIAEYLVQHGHFVRVLDDFYTGKMENLKFAGKLGKDKFELIRGSVTDKAVCAKACQGMDYVLHQAALRSIPESMSNPQSYNETNINGTLFMLQAASKHKVKRFVFASSSAIYGDADNFPQQEGQLPLLLSPYALSKLAGEHYCGIFSRFFNLETVCLRYFNVFGPKQALDDEYSVVIPKFIRCALRGEPLPIFGNGKQSRDFIFIENVVSANFLAATTPGVSPEVFNVASGKETTILDLAEVLNRIIGKEIKTQFLPVRQGDIFRSQADITKISKKLNFKLLISFEEGLIRTVEYFRKNTTW